MDVIESTSSSAQPRARPEHVYVVVRVRQPMPDGAAAAGPADDDVMTPKAYFSEQEAELEAQRLNEQHVRFWRHFVRVAKLGPPGEPGESG